MFKIILKNEQNFNAEPQGRVGPHNFKTMPENVPECLKSIKGWLWGLMKDKVSCKEENTVEESEALGVIWGPVTYKHTGQTTKSSAL